MSPFKKILATVLAAGLLVAAAAGFTRLLNDNFPEEEPYLSMEAYPHAISVPTEETVPETTEATLPPETLPPETTIPEETRPRYDYETVPKMYMTDYPDILYRTGTIATTGSDVTAMAMVASYLTGYEYTPGQLGVYFETFIGNRLQWLEHVSDALQLPWKKAGNFWEVRKALEEGKIAITMMEEDSRFGTHFIVLTGLNAQGRIVVNDPNPKHQDQWYLKHGLADGFTNNDLMNGYGGSWIYDPEAMPEEPFLYEPEETAVTFRYEGIELSKADKNLMAKLIYMEARSEPFEGQQAVAEVLLNRLAADNFPDSIYAIIHAPGQFLSSGDLDAAKPIHTQYVAIERALNGPYVVPKDVVFFSTFEINDNVWGTIGNHIFCHQWSRPNATEATAPEGETE